MTSVREITLVERHSYSSPYIVWIMGPTSSGKTTIASHFVQRQHDAGIPVVHLDGDVVRDSMGKIGFEKKDRLLVIRALIAFAKEELALGRNVVVSALTAHEDARKMIAEEFNDVLVVSVQCSIDVCAQRDPKGLYRLAMAGEIDTLIGYNTPYPLPKNPALVLDTESCSVSGAAMCLAEFLVGKGFESSGGMTGMAS